MPSKTLSAIRETYPQLNHIPDNEIIVKIGNKYPKALQLDKELASEHEKLTSFTAGGAAYDVYTRGVKGGLLNLAGIASGVVEAGAAQLKEIGGAFPDIQKQVFGKIEEWADTAGDFYEEKAAEQVAAAEANMPSGLERGLGKLTSVATTAIAPLAAGPVGGYPAVIAASGLTTFGSTYRSAKNSYEEAGNPDAHSKAAKIALADGLKTSVITAIGGAVAQKFGGADIEKLTALGKTPAFRTGVKDYVKRLGVGIPTEAVEEGIDEGISAAIAQHSYNPDADISDAFTEAAIYSMFLAGAAGNIEHGVEVLNAKREARRLNDAGLRETAKKVFQQKLEAIKAKEQEAQQAEPKESPEAKLEKNLENTPTGGTKPVDQLPELPQSQLDAMPEPLDASNLTVDLDEIPGDTETTEAEEQAELIDTPTFSEEDIIDLAEKRVLSDYGLVEVPAETFKDIPQMSPEQREEYDENVKFYEGAYKQYENNPEAWNKELSQKSDKKLAGTERETVIEPATEAKTETQPQAVENAGPVVISPENQSDYESVLDALVNGQSVKGRNLRVQLMNTWANMKAKTRGGKTTSGYFKWAKWAGRAANTQGNSVHYPAAFSNDLDRFAVEEFRASVQKLAAKAGTDELSMLNKLKQESFDVVKNKKQRSIKKSQVDSLKLNNQLAAEDNANLNNDTEGSDILDDLSEVNTIYVPVNNQGKITLSPDKRTSEHDGIDDFLTAAATWFNPSSGFPKAAGIKLQKVSEDEFVASFKPDELIQELSSAFPRYKGMSTSDLYSDLSYAIDRRVDNKGTRNRGAVKANAEAEFAKQQIEAEEAADTVNDDQLPESTKVTEDEEVPFAALPPNLVNGVQIEAGTNGDAQELMNLVAKLLPSIQKNLGGAKVTHIRIDETAEAPAYSAVRSGDFGTVFLNPSKLADMQATGQLDLSRVITEEIIHNYNGLALYRAWKQSGAPGTWQSYYESSMLGVYNEMNASEIQDTVYYYSGGIPDSEAGSAFLSDPVNVAEEYLRILLQRELTGGINEDLFQKVRERSALQKILHILRRFWNGLTRGFMRRSPAVKSLKRRTKALLQDRNTKFPAIDRELTTLLTRASGGQDLFNFSNPPAEANKIDLADSSPKPENGFNDNEGTHLGWLFNQSKLDALTEETPSSQPAQLEVEGKYDPTFVESADQDWTQRLASLDELNVAEALTRNETKGIKKSDYIDASVARFTQNQDPTPLPDVVLEMTYTRVKEIIDRNPALVPANQQEIAFWYTYSRVLNDGRRYLARHRNAQETDLQILSESGEGRKSWNLSNKTFNTLKDFRRRIKGNVRRGVGSGEGLVSIDESMPNESGQETEKVEVLKVANPFDIDPARRVVNQAVGNVLNTVTPTLNSRERDLLNFLIQEDFASKSKKKFADTRGITKGRVSQMWSEISAKIIVQMSTGKLGEYKRAELKNAINDLPKGIRKGVLDVLKFQKDLEAGKVKVRKRMSEPERLAKLAEDNLKTIESMNDAINPPTNAEKLYRRNLAAIKKLTQFDRKITSAAIPPSLHAAAKQAKTYRGKVDSSKPVVDTDARPPLVKERMKSAEGVNETFFENVYDSALNAATKLKGWFRTYRHLDPKEYGNVIDILRQFEANPELSTALAADSIRGIISGLNAKQLDKFKRILVLRDLKRSIDEGLYDNKDLPLGFRNTLEVEAALTQDEQDLANPANSDIADALQRRKSIFDLVTAELQAAGLLPQKIASGEDYFHRITLEYRANGHKYEGPAPSDMRTGRAGFQKKRKGSDKDYSTNYFASEFEVLSQSYSQLETLQTLSNLKGLLDKKKLFLNQANQKNLQALANAGYDTSTFFDDQNKKIAIAISQLTKMINDGSLNYSNKYNDVASSLRSQQRHPDFFGFLKHLSSTKSGGEMYANMIFKAIREKETNIQNALGKGYNTWRTLAAESGEYTVWQPEKGNYLYRGTVASDQALINWYENANPGDQKTISADDLRKALVLGGRKEEWVIPNAAATQLDALKPNPVLTAETPAGSLARTHQKWLAKWKYWKLFNPLSVTKYNINNMSGDADIAFAYDPVILKDYSKQAMQDLYAFHVKNQPMSRDIEDMIRAGVIGSGAQLQDIGEMNTELAYEALFGDILDSTRTKSSWWKSATNNYTRKVAKYNQLREDTLRVAAYRYFKDRLAKGETPTGVSKKVELDKLPNDKAKAAKLSRELLGDYGAISEAGKFIRANIIPFWSWMEINAPRYVRLMRNSFQEGQGVGRAAGVAAKKGAVQATKVALLAQTLPFFVNAFNEVMIAAGAVDEEDKRVIDARNQQHLLLYSSEDGRVISVRMQGALTDALEWLGLGSVYSTTGDILAGRLNIADAVEDYVSTGEYWSAGLQRVSSGLNPFVKVPIELITKLKFYPDMINPSPMRDRWRYALDQMTFNWTSSAAALAYRLYQDFPERGAMGSGNLVNDMIDFVGYSTDTGEAAYNYIKAKEYSFMREIDGDQGTNTTNAKSDALYYYNKARSYGDKGAAERWKKEYIALGGKVSGMKRSEKGRAPLARVKKNHRKDFLRSLTEVDQAILDQAQDWHKKRTR